MKRTFWLLIVMVLLLAAGCATVQTDLDDADAYTNRGIAYLKTGQYDKAWEDVDKAQDLGYKINPQFLKILQEASGRQK